MNYLFTSESVSEGHPDKVADQISDAVLDRFLAADPSSKVACETLVTTGQVVVAGEVRSTGYVDIDSTVRDVIRRIGYNKAEYGFDAASCGILSAIHEQSPDINRGVDRANPEEQGAGDQGIMFGYATNETLNYLPLPIDLAHDLLYELAQIRKHEPQLMPYLRPDAKSQVTIEYTPQGKAVGIHTLLISTQHDEFIHPQNNTPQAIQEADEAMRAKITEDIQTILIPRVAAHYREQLPELFSRPYRLLVNPTGKFVIGGPHGDTGLTGRKIIVDTYGGRASHGGGAFSGKDPSKVDRSAAYAARHIAKNMVAAGVADEVLVQLSYAIGVAAPTSVYVRTGGKHVPQSDAELAQVISRVFDLRPYAIEQRLGLRNPIFEETAAYGHFGRDSYRKVKELPGGYRKEIEFFSWEKTDYVPAIRSALNL